MRYIQVYSIEFLKKGPIKFAGILYGNCCKIFPLSLFIFSSCIQLDFFDSRLTSEITHFPADGRSEGKVILNKSLFGPEDKFLDLNEMESEYIQILRIEKNTFRSVLHFKSKRKAGKIQVQSESGKNLTLFFEITAADLDSDSFPDAAELHTEEDRIAFQNWFVRIAESQFRKTNYGWNREERDCSGLVRFSYREAMKKHDSVWFKKNGIGIDKNLPDLTEFHYPDVPILGEKIFKIKSGPAEDLNTFGVYANAKTLMDYNTTFISRDIRESKPGDLLIYYDSENFRSPYHVVIVTKNDLQGIILLYHTGDEQGIKRVYVQYLNTIRKFAPESWNENFLGVFRFSILM